MRAAAVVLMVVRRRASSRAVSGADANKHHAAVKVGHAPPLSLGHACGVDMQSSPTATRPPQPRAASPAGPLPVRAPRPHTPPPARQLRTLGARPPLNRTFPRVSAAGDALPLRLVGDGGELRSPPQPPRAPHLPCAGGATAAVGRQQHVHTTECARPEDASAAIVTGPSDRLMTVPRPWRAVHTPVRGSTRQKPRIRAASWDSTGAGAREKASSSSNRSTACTRRAIRW